jgi:hypothetical protein
MTMPVLPALSNPSAGVAGPLTDVLDAMSEEDIVDLCNVATEWAASAGEGPEITEDPNLVADTDLDTPADDSTPGETAMMDHNETNETLEQEASESPDEQTEEAEAGSENFDGLLTQVETEASKSEGLLTQFDDFIDQAEMAVDEGGDPDAIEALKSDATDLVGEIDGLLNEAQAARKDEDAEGIAQAGLMIREKNELLSTLLAQAAVHAKTNKPTAPTKGAIPDATPALKLWAQRYGAE